MIKKYVIFVVASIFMLCALSSCQDHVAESVPSELSSESDESSNGNQTGSLENDHEDISHEIDKSHIYIPMEYRNMDFEDTDSQWCFNHSRQSEHFIVFWEKDFGNDPSSPDCKVSMRVDVDEILKRAENYYKTEIELLGFGNNTSEKSYLDQYKMQIWLNYDEEWIAQGAGYDDIIGALWVSPSACNSSGVTLAHEIGHCFQYQIYCDSLLNGAENDFSHGFRYACRDGMGNCFWEQTAQWQSFADFGEYCFASDDMKVWFENYYRGFENEWKRYQDYWLLFSVSDLYGEKAVSEIWKNSCYPEDSILTYKRIFCNNSYDDFSDDVWYYASHAATFDFGPVVDFSDIWQHKYSTKLFQTEDGYYRVAYGNCPGDIGFNVIPVSEILPGCDEIYIDFRGLDFGSQLAEEDDGRYYINPFGISETGGFTETYNGLPDGCISEPGWVYGFVAYCNDGSRIYSEPMNTREGRALFSVPKNAEDIYFVVAGVMKDHIQHVWDEDELSDVQLPYEIKPTFCVLESQL